MYPKIKVNQFKELYGDSSKYVWIKGILNTEFKEFITVINKNTGIEITYELINNEV